MKLWENRQAQQAARISGLGLMAVSLAACGGDSTTTTSSTTPTTPVAPVNQAFALTIGVDSVAGGAGNDTISGARIDTVQTWNSADVISGGAGTDTLTATIATNVTPATAGVTGVENLVVTGITAATVVDFSSDTANFITGVTSITNIGSAQTVGFEDITGAAAMTVNGASAATTFQYNDSVLSGTSDSLTLNLIGATAAVTVGTNSDADGDYETLIINATGAASDLVAGGGLGGDATTVTVNASVALDLGTTAAFGAATSFNAAGSSAAVTAVFEDFDAADANATAITTAKTITGGSGADNFDVSAMEAADVGVLTVSGGAGNDTITLGSYAETTMILTGGDGTDTLAFSATPTVGTFDAVSGFETLTSTVVIADAATTTLDLSVFATSNAISRVNVSGTNTNNVSGNDIYAITNARDEVLHLGVGTTDILGDDVTISFARRVDGSANSLTVHSLAAIAVVAITANDEETITFNSADGAIELTTGLNAADMTSLVVTGDNTVDLSAVAAASLAAVNASGLTDAAGLIISSTSSTVAMTVTANTATSGYTGTLNVTTGSNADTITGTENNDTLNGGGGNDTITGNGGVDTIDGGDGNDTINGGAGADIITGGAGVDTITTGAGADTLHFTLTGVTGSAGGDVVTDFTVGTGGDIIDMSSMGNTALGALTAVVADGATGAQAHADNTILRLTTNLAANYDTQAEIATLFGVGAEFAAVAQDDENVLIISAADTGHSYVWMLIESNTNTSLADAADTVSLVAVLQNVDSVDLAAMVAGNFVA